MPARRPVPPTLAPDVEPDELTDDEIVARLREAARDEQEGRLICCDSAEELRAFFASMGTHPRDP